MHDEERDFLGLINAATAVQLRGWNFSFLAGRTISQPLPWDYLQLAQLAVRSARRVLDVDTGGGEVLAAIAPPAGSIAVEPHPPNLAVAAATLSPQIEVRPRVSARLPAADAEVDLVLNRHGALDVQEAFRVLQVGGTLLSQQVGRHNDTEFNEALRVPPLGGAAIESVDNAITALVGAGFQVARCEEARPQTRYLDIGAIVLQLRAVSWQVPGFDVQQHLDQLRRIHHHIGQHGSFTVTSHRLLLIAHRP